LADWILHCVWAWWICENTYVQSEKATCGCSPLVRSIPEPLVGGWVGPEVFWNLPRLGFLLFFWWFRPNGAGDLRFPLARSFSRWLAGYPTPPPRTLACRTSPTSLMTSCDDKTWSASAKLPNLDSCSTYAFGVSSDDQKE
jgi:hypothetical protein